MAGEPFVKGMPHITEKIYGLIKVRAIHDVSMLAHATVIHAFRRWRSRRTIDLSVKNNPNPRILEWPMPGSVIITPSGCFLGIEKSFFLLLNLGLNKGHYISETHSNRGGGTKCRRGYAIRWKNGIVNEYSFKLALWLPRHGAFPYETFPKRQR